MKNQQTLALIQELKKTAIEQKVPLWKRIAEELESTPAPRPAEGAPGAVEGGPEGRTRQARRRAGAAPRTSAPSRSAPSAARTTRPVAPTTPSAVSGPAMARAITSIGSPSRTSRRRPADDAAAASPATLPSPTCRAVGVAFSLPAKTTAALITSGATGLASTAASTVAISPRYVRCADGAGRAPGGCAGPPFVLGTLLVGASIRLVGASIRPDPAAYSGSAGCRKSGGPRCSAGSSERPPTRPRASSSMAELRTFNP